MKNKIFTLALIAIFALALAACAPSADLEKPFELQPTEVVVAPTAMPQPNLIVEDLVELLATNVTGKAGERIVAIRLLAHPNVTSISLNGMTDYETGKRLYISWDFASSGWSNLSDEAIGFTIPDDLPPGTYQWNQKVGYNMDGVQKSLTFFMTLHVVE